MTKVLLVTSEFPPQPGGIGAHALAVATYLSKRGFDVVVSCDQRSENGEEELIFDKKQPFVVHRTKRKKPLLRTFSNRVRIAKKHAKNADVVLVSGKFSLWIGGYLKRQKQTKVIAILHGSELLLKNTSLRKFTKRSLLRMDACISVSNYTASLLKNETGLDSAVIFNGFMQSQTMPSKITQKDNDIKLITVGNVTQRKGQHNVIEALPLLNTKFKNIEYQMVGIPSDKERVLLKAKALSVADQISFLGRVSEEEKIKLLKEATVFVMLSEQTESGDVEGFGIAILEANAIGIPAIGAKFCGIEDAINDGFSGKLVDPHNPQEIVEAVAEILNNYEAYSDNAIQWASRFTWEKLIDDYIAIINHL